VADVHDSYIPEENKKRTLAPTYAFGHQFRKPRRMRMPDSIYLDNQATTPTDPRVRDALLPFLETSAVGNPHSEHFVGRRAAAAVEDAREKVAALIGARPQEIVFTSGATEANNIALQGIARSPYRRGNHIITCATEHKCVLKTVDFLARSGFRAEIMPVDANGLIDTAALAAAITTETCLVSIMAANNEIGVLQPIDEIAAICRSRGVVFHTDAAQAAGKIPIDVKMLGVDLMSLSGHKLYAPIGVGALYVAEESPIAPEPLFWGGGQERGLRSGTIALRASGSLLVNFSFSKGEVNGCSGPPLQPLLTDCRPGLLEVAGIAAMDRPGSL
jgi:cysteine desulfurase